MKTVKQSHRVNSREHLKELLSGKYKYFTLEFEGSTIHQDGMTKLVSESYRIPNKLKKELEDKQGKDGTEQFNKEKMPIKKKIKLIVIITIIVILLLLVIVLPFI